MSEDQLVRDTSLGVVFYGYEDDNGHLLGVMGFQQLKDVVLVRHAYVRPDYQGTGIGSRPRSHWRCEEREGPTYRPAD
jgi:GNAT superfamily N-acetyltransferase